MVLPQGDSHFRRRAAVVAVVTLAVLAGLLAALRPARIDGHTAAERIASIARLAEEKPRGAGKAIDAAATGAAEPAEVRAAALAALAEFVPRFRPTVEASLAETDGRLRAAAAATLGRFDDTEAAERLSPLLQTDPDESVRKAAARGLLRNGSPHAIAALVRAMEYNDMAEVRREAVSIYLNRSGLSPPTPPDPADEAAWKDMVSKIRGFPEVRAALAASGGAAEITP